VSDFFAAYGLFLAELATLAALVAGVILLIVAARRGGHGEGLVVRHMNRSFEDAADELKLAIDGKGRFKKETKARLKERKREERARERDAQNARPRTFVLDFKGDLRASAVASLREEVSAVLQVAKPTDEVLLRLENPGGTVHEHGLAASQLLRLKQRGLALAVVVDKVAASGGYLMACVADRLIAAPFAIIGSIGVLAQLPNFNRLLEEKGIDFEQVTAGRYKRTLTMFGKNTPEGREKLRQEVEDVHELFKAQIREYRPQIDLERVATGEHWYGVRALELKLVDELRTSDDWLLEAAKDRDLYHVAYKRRRTWQERALGGVDSLVERIA
jgi:serine protease SohB